MDRMRSTWGEALTVESVFQPPRTHRVTHHTMLSGGKERKKKPPRNKGRAS